MRKRWEDDINEFLKQEFEANDFQSRAAIKPTKLGSTLPKTVENALYWKKITQ